MSAIFSILGVFLLFLLLFLGVGIGIGFLLHWLIPVIGVDMGTLIGVITLGWAIHFFAKVMRAVLEFREDDSEFETIVLRPLRPPRSRKRKK